MLRVCVVKQNSCYDLYTKTGPDLASIVASSNWRSGPIGLWEAFDCDVRIVFENPDPECQVGKHYWEGYVQGWDIWPEGGVAESAENVDWSIYDIVISIDVAVPRRIVKQFRNVMWCYYFVEGGPTAIETIFRGSPFYGYNVFLNHRLSKSTLNFEAKAAKSICQERRAVLDFPYYLHSSHSIQQLYPKFCGVERRGTLLSHHSYDVLGEEEWAALSELGEVRQGYESISDIHKLELVSKYFVVHPNSKQSAGLALIEAISAGCLALAPKSNIWGFPELVSDELEYGDFDALMNILRRLENDREYYALERIRQASKVDEWCFVNPISNLEFLYGLFNRSTCSVARQVWAETRAGAKAHIELGVAAAIRRSNSLTRRMIKR